MKPEDRPTKSDQKPSDIALERKRLDVVRIFEAAGSTPRANTSEAKAAEQRRANERRQHDRMIAASKNLDVVH